MHELRHLFPLTVCTYVNQMLKICFVTHSFLSINGQVQYSASMMVHCVYYHVSTCVSMNKTACVWQIVQDVVRAKAYVQLAADREVQALVDLTALILLT